MLTDGEVHVNFLLFALSAVSVRGRAKASGDNLETTERTGSNTFCLNKVMSS